MRRSQEDRSSSTKSALVSAARELFAARGYHAVPADEIVRAAGVSRGALYHHYADKQGLFRAVFEELERDVAGEVEAALTTAPDFGTGMVTALGAFLDACGRPEVRQISLTDAPAVLGWRTWRQIEGEYGLGMVIGALEQATAQGLLAPQPVRVLAQLILSAVMEAALLIANAEDPARERAEAEQALGAWLLGLLPQP
ncbi:TetR/AcrR family transcriptional regulator [Amycolatopsis nigrescens]|uniref:TetR/AcrR family transcriptional regulator n=1 Tax=Amycolatopsis nigrescens TaxID=381445 RepID=UPI00037E89B4|nr:TetR/AcrR family transcriptional regulator [Amycolatopsis nigrescens]